MKDLQSQHDCWCFCKRKTGHGLLKECQNNNFGHFIYFYIKKNDKDVKMTGFHSEVFPVHPLGLFQVANVENCFICLYPYMKSAVNRKHFSLRKSAKGQYSILESIVITK